MQVGALASALDLSELAGDVAHAPMLGDLSARDAKIRWGMLDTLARSGASQGMLPAALTFHAVGGIRSNQLYWFRVAHSVRSTVCLPSRATRMAPMWQQLKTLWQIWTIDKPAKLGDFLWDVFVVQFAAFLDRLTLRRVIALIPLVIVILAYEHNIPLPPELMLVGDLLAYLDIVSVLLLFSILSRVSTILFVVKQIVARATQLMLAVHSGLRRLDVRHRRVSSRRHQLKGGQSDDDGCPVVYGLAWA
jgi:hypothetical protein